MAKQYTVDEMKAMAVAAAQQYGIDPVMFTAQLQQESNWDASAKSTAGARGVAQFMPGTAKRFNIDPLDPAQAIPAAAKYMSILKKRYGGDEATARMGYNWGEGNVDKYLRGEKQLPQETASYNQKIYKIAGVGENQEQRFPQRQFAQASQPAQQPQQSDNFLNFLFSGSSNDPTIPDATRMQIAQKEESDMASLQQSAEAQNQNDRLASMMNSMAQAERDAAQAENNMRKILNDMWDEA